MNIDAKFFGAIIFVIVQTCGIEIHNLKKLTGDQKEVQEAVKDLDVMVYRLQSIETMLDKILATKVR